MLQRLAHNFLGLRCASREVEPVLDARYVPLELAPAVGVRKAAIISGEMPVERGQDAQKLVHSRHGWLILAKRFRIALPLVEEAGAQPVAQLDAASGASGVQHCVPSPVLPFHPHAHHPSLTLHLKEEVLAGDDRDGLAPWHLNGPLSGG